MRFVSFIVATVMCSASALALDTGTSAVSGGTGVVTDNRAGALVAATQALQLALQQRHAEVTQWSIRPLVTERALQALPTTAPSGVRVTHAGARSAVRLTWALASTYVTTFWFEVSGIASAVVTNRDLAPGAAVSAADAIFVERDVMELSCTAVLDPAQLQQMRMRRALRAGTPICREAIEPRPAVMRGEDVVVRFVSPRVSITSKGIAQADAHIGQNVFVMNAASRDAFRAVVSALKEVVVYE